MCVARAMQSIKQLTQRDLRPQFVALDSPASVTLIGTMPHVTRKRRSKCLRDKGIWGTEFLAKPAPVGHVTPRIWQCYSASEKGTVPPFATKTMLIRFLQHPEALARAIPC